MVTRIVLLAKRSKGCKRITCLVCTLQSDFLKTGELHEQPGFEDFKVVLHSLEPWIPDQALLISFP